MIQGGECFHITPFDQPYKDASYATINGFQELVEYLPGTSLRIWYTHQEASCSDHWHNAYEIIVGENDAYDIRIGERTFVVGENAILIIPAGVAHELRPRKNCTGYVYLIELDFVSRIKSAQGIMAQLSHPILLEKAQDCALYGAAWQQLQRMRDVYFSDNHLRELLICADMLVLIEKLASSDILENDEAMAELDRQHKYKAKFDEILLYIGQHYTDQLSISSIARQFGFSKFYFARLFKKYSSYSYSDYLNRCRLKAAEYLMARTELSITDIAFQVGFNSLPTFSRLFKQHRGCTPSEYRSLFTK